MPVARNAVLIDLCLAVAETDSLETESAGVKFSSGSNSVLRSGSNTVYLTGGECWAYCRFAVGTSPF